MNFFNRFRQRLAGTGSAAVKAADHDKRIATAEAKVNGLTAQNDEAKKRVEKLALLTSTIHEHRARIDSELEKLEELL